MLMVRYAEICPFTGLVLGKRHRLTSQANKLSPMLPTLALYEFKPIGRALIDAGTFLQCSLMVEDGIISPSIALAGICRQAYELGQDPPTVTVQMFEKVDAPFPKTFMEKREHLLKLICDAGGEERIERDIYTHEDFPLGFADSPKQLHRLLESLIEEGLLRYEDSYTVQGDYEDGFLAHYHEVLPTPTGRKLARSTTQSPIIMPANNSYNFSNSTVHLVQGDNATQTNVLGNNANVNVAHGNNNSQANTLQPAGSLQELLDQLAPVLCDAAFDAHREEIDAEIERIKVQLTKAEPKKSLIKRAFDSLLGSLQEIAAEGAGAVIAQTAIELVKQGPLLLATLTM